MATRKDIDWLERAYQKADGDLGDFQFELASAYRDAGRDDDAERLLKEVASGDDALDTALAYGDLADLRFSQGRDAEAWQYLERIRTDPRLAEGGLLPAAEMLEMRGELTEALAWFTRAVGVASDDPVADLTAGSRMSTLAHAALGRARVREALGQPPDEIDKAIPSASDMMKKLRRLGSGGPDVRMLVMNAHEHEKARRQWPDAHDIAAEELLRRNELDNRQRSADGVSRIVLVWATVDSLLEYAEAEGSDPLDPDLRESYIYHRYDEGHTTPWPPPRNAPCWCGASTKYKKCHGRPDLG